MTCEKPYLAPICVRLFHRHTNLCCLGKIVFLCVLKRFLRTSSRKNEHDVREKRFNTHAILRNFLHASIKKLHRQGAGTDPHP